MPQQTAKHDNAPINETDRQARAAFRQHCDDTGGYAAFAQRNGMNQRSAERIYAMRRDVPPGLARTVAAEIREDFATMNRRPQLADRARALELWAQDCADRSAAYRAAKRGQMRFSNGTQMDFGGGDGAALKGKETKQSWPGGDS